MSTASLDQLIVKTEKIFSSITFYITLYIYSAKEQALFPSIYVLYKLKLFLIHPNENLSHYKVFLKNQQHYSEFKPASRETSGQTFEVSLDGHEASTDHLMGRGAEGWVGHELESLETGQVAQGAGE